jgi:hypothetical protein
MLPDPLDSLALDDVFAVFFHGMPLIFL